MSIANKLFDRSHGFIGDVNATNPDDLPALYISGTLPRAVVKQKYSGRLKINNAIGACSVKLLTGSLPPGNMVTVDNTTHEVIVGWPAFKTGSMDIPNANFEKGDDGSWEVGPGFTIESTGTAPDPNDPGSVYQLQFANLHADPDGPDTMSNVYFPLADARALGQGSITASADVQQGASSENQAGAAVRILFYDNVGLQVGGMDGNVIKSGSDSVWQTSTVNAPIPALASYARVGGVAYRKGQNRALWIDNIRWDLQQASQGTSQQQTITLSVQVTDSAGRIADWSGTIIVSPPIQVINRNVSSDDFVTSSIASTTFTYVTYHNGKFIGVSSTVGTLSCPVYSSDDGLTYTQVGALTLPSTNCAIYGIVSTPTAVLILENWSGVYRSTDTGRTWTKVYASGNTWADTSFFYSNGLMVAGGSGGVPLRYSLDDGLTWSNTPVTIVSTSVNGLAYFNGKWVTLGVDKGVLIPSFCQFDGGTWTVFNPTISTGMQQVGLIAKVGSKVYIQNRGKYDLFITEDFVNYQHINTPSTIFTAITESPDGRAFMATGGGSVYIDDGGILTAKGGVFTTKISDQFLFLE